MEPLFSESELHAIANALGATGDGLTNREIDELLQLAKVKDEFGPGTKWERIYYNLWNQQCRNGHRKACNAFIRKAMKPERYIGNPERFHIMRDNVNKALSFAGLYVGEAGDLQRVDRVHTLAEAEKRANELRLDLASRGVHKDVLRFCRAELLQEDYFHAVQEAVKSVMDKLRMLTNRNDDGVSLIDAALSGQSPILIINSFSTQSEKMEQAGFGNLIKGTYGMFRNPTSHEARIKWVMKKEDAEDLLSIASLIHRRIDSSIRK